MNRYVQEQALISYFQGIKARIKKELPHLEKCSGVLRLTVIDMRLIEWEYENFSEIEKFQIRAIINSQAISEL
jgi:hypothetical protein